MSTRNYTYYSLTDAQMTEQANEIMQLIEQRAYEDGLISDSQAFSKKYSIVLVKKGTFTKWFEKMFMPDVTEGQAAFVILKNPPSNQKETSNE